MNINIEPIPDWLESNANVSGPFHWSQAKIAE